MEITVRSGPALLREIEDVVDLLARNHENVARGHGVDIEKGVMLLIGGHLVGWDFAGCYLAEDG